MIARLIEQDNDNDNSYTPSGPSSLTSARRVLYYKSFKECIQSQTSLSNFSTHTAPSAIYKDWDVPPDEPPAPPSEPHQGVWRPVPQRRGFRRLRKKSGPRPVGPIIETTPPAGPPPPDRAQTTGSWVTWQVQPGVEYSPPSSPAIHLAPEMPPPRGLFGPRSPRQEDLSGQGPPPWPPVPPPDRVQTTGSWATWQVQPGIEYTPPSSPTIRLAPEMSPPRGLFGPRSPRREDHSGQDRRPHTPRHHASDPSRDQNFPVSDLNYSGTTSAREALHHKSSKESIQSYQTSLSNFSTHTAPSAIYKDQEHLSGQDRRPHASRHHASDPSRDQNFSVSDLNYSDTIQKSTFSLKNESQSNVSTAPGVEPDRRSPDVHDIHPVHSAPEMGVKPLSRSYSHSEISISVGTNDNVDESLALRHPGPGICCYHCQQDIVGVRFRCVDCTTIDIDICWNCEIAGFPGDLEVPNGGHSSSHAMLKIPMSLNMQEIQHISQRADDLRHAGSRLLSRE